MKKEILFPPFWDENLNPITMHPKESILRKNKAAVSSGIDPLLYSHNRRDLNPSLFDEVKCFGSYIRRSGEVKELFSIPVKREGNHIWSPYSTEIVTAKEMRKLSKENKLKF